MVLQHFRYGLRYALADPRIRIGRHGDAGAGNWRHDCSLLPGAGDDTRAAALSRGRPSGLCLAVWRLAGSIGGLGPDLRIHQGRPRQRRAWQRRDTALRGRRRAQQPEPEPDRARRARARAGRARDRVAAGGNEGPDRSRSLVSRGRGRARPEPRRGRQPRPVDAPIRRRSGDRRPHDRPQRRSAARRRRHGT